MLAEEVPNNTNKNQIPSLRSQLSNHVQSVASPQYKHQLKYAWRRSSLISAFFSLYPTKVKHNLLPKGLPNQDQGTYIPKTLHMIS